MSKLKWFSGGEEREKTAVKIIDELLANLKNDENSSPLQKVLFDYKIELEKKDISVPMNLSRMNMDISSVFRSNGSELSQSQAKQMKELSEVSNIRYGY